MNKKMLEKAGVNYEEGLKRFSGNVALYEKFLNKFLADETMSACRSAIDNKDYNEVLSAIHTLKGVAGNLSMNGLYKKCAVLVDNLRATRTDNMEELFKEIQTAYSQVVDALLAP